MNPKSYGIFAILFLAVIGFELYNFSANEFALRYFYPSQTFFGVPWSALLAMASCLTDFAAISTIFARNPKEDSIARYLRYGWFLAAIFDAGMNWWATSLSMLSNPVLGNEILARADLLTTVPALVAIMVLLIRVSLVGALSVTEFEKPKAKVKLPPLTRPRKVPVNGSFDIESIAS